MAALDLTRLRAVIFGTDGVVTDTARVHAAAWKHVFDGRSRLDGVRTFLASRGITLPEGGPGDEPGGPTVALLQDRSGSQEAAMLRAGAHAVVQDLAEPTVTGRVPMGAR